MVVNKHRAARPYQPEIRNSKLSLMTDTTRIIGIDPGSRITGFGVIELQGAGYTYVASGNINTQGDSLAERLRTLFEGLEDVMARYAPQVMAVERVFVQRNPDSALKLGQARGVAVCAGALKSLPVYEYTPTEIKKALTGKGSAAKVQVQHMVKVLLKVTGVTARRRGGCTGLRAVPQPSASHPGAYRPLAGATRRRACDDRPAARRPGPQAGAVSARGCPWRRL